METMKKILNIAFNCVIYILIGILSIYLFLVFYQKFVQKSDLMSIGDFYIFQIASSSMETDLHIGDYILVKKTSDLKIGDVITFKENGIYITHRIYNFDNNEIITKGDANESSDGIIEKENILGKVLFKLHIFTFISKYRFIFISLIVSLYIFDLFIKKSTNIEEAKEKILE